MQQQCEQQRKLGAYLSAIGVLLFLLMLSACGNNAPEQRAAELVPIHIGYQTAWTGQGQIAHVLKRTNILELNGLKGEFTGFTYGMPLSEAALAGEVDVGFAADQPIVSLLARGGKFKVVARIPNGRAAIIVPLESDIRTIADLKGKILAIPFGSSTHRIALGMLRDAGLDPDRDLKIINMDITEQAGVVSAGTDKQWKGAVDALASWDPNILIFENKGFARVLKQEVALGFAYLSEDFIQQHPEATVAFIKSFIEAYYYYVTNQAQANQWFAEEARIQFDPALLDVAASFEPNMQAKEITDIDVRLTENHLAQMRAGAEFAYSRKLITAKPDLEQAFDTALVDQAEKLIAEEPLEWSNVRTS